MNNAWLDLLYRLWYRPECETSPRGQRTRELLVDRLVVDMTRSVLTATERRLGYRFLPAEAAWILSGDDRVSTIVPYSKTIAQFSDDGETFFGAYGPRIVSQLYYVIKALRRDRDTRQAVLNIWRESPPPSKDVPCTLSCQFLIRDDLLHLVVTMRSSDAWLGVPYDVFSFSMLAGYVLLELGDPDLQLGRLYHVAGSRHLYERNWSDAHGCLLDQSSAFSYAPFNPHDFESGADLIAHLWALARRDRDDLRGSWLVELFDLHTKRKET